MHRTSRSTSNSSTSARSWRKHASAAPAAATSRAIASHVANASQKRAREMGVPCASFQLRTSSRRESSSASLRGTAR
eukprot:2580146-Prymnesium_polylepis.1